MTPSKKENLPQLRNRKQFKKFSLNDSRTRAGPSISKEPAEPEIIDLSEAGPSFRPLPKLLTQTNEVICLSSDDEDASSQMSVLDLVKSAVDKSFNSSNSLFYEDKSTKYDQNEVPVYTIASQETLTENSNSVDSKIIVDEVNMVESQPDDSVVFVYEEKLDRRPNSKDSFIPLAVRFFKILTSKDFFKCFNFFVSNSSQTIETDQMVEINLRLRNQRQQPQFKLKVLQRIHRKQAQFNLKVLQEIHRKQPQFKLKVLRKIHSQQRPLESKEK